MNLDWKAIEIKEVIEEIKNGKNSKLELAALKSYLKSLLNDEDVSEEISSNSKLKALGYSESQISRMKEESKEEILNGNISSEKVSILRNGIIKYI